MSDGAYTGPQAPILAGDPRDDDGQVLDAMYATAPNPPDVPQIVREAGTPVLSHQIKPPRLTRFIASNIRLLPGQTDPVQLAVADPNREALSIRVSSPPVNIDGWVQLMPRQTINGAELRFGDPMDARDWTNLYLMVIAHTLTGTTTSAQGRLYGVRPDGATITGSAYLTSITLTVATTVISSIRSPIGSDTIRGAMNTIGASGDSVLDFELWAYREGSTANTGKLVGLSDDPGKLAYLGGASTAALLPEGVYPFDNHTGNVWCAPMPGLVAPVDITVMGVSK